MCWMTSCRGCGCRANRCNSWNSCGCGWNRTCGCGCRCNQNCGNLGSCNNSCFNNTQTNWEPACGYADEIACEPCGCGCGND